MVPRPRVLVVITRGEPGGAQRHVLELVRGLGAEVEFHVIVGDDDWLSGEVRPFAQVTVLPTLQRSVDPRADLRTLRALRAAIRDFAPDLVHTHSSKAGVLGRVAARSLGVPTLHTAHAWSFSDGQPPSRVALAVPVEAALGRITDRFIAVSAADEEVALRWHVARPGQVAVIHNGLSDVPERGVPDAAHPVVVMAARMAAPKDHLGLLEAVARVPNLRLRFAGDGPDRPTIEAAVDRLQLRDRVELLGVRDDVPAVLAGAQIAALISRQEGFPLAVLEGMRAGLPVVASDVGGIREAIQDGREGFLVPRGDVVRLCGRLSQLADDPALRRRMGLSARSTWEARFEVSAGLMATRAEYAKLINNGHPATDYRETRTAEP